MQLCPVGPELPPSGRPAGKRPFAPGRQLGSWARASGGGAEGAPLPGAPLSLHSPWASTSNALHRSVRCFVSLTPLDCRLAKAGDCLTLVGEPGPLAGRTEQEAPKQGALVNWGAERHEGKRGRTERRGAWGESETLTPLALPSPEET